MIRSTAPLVDAENFIRVDEIRLVASLLNKRSILPSRECKPL
jgi:hypothetical protein